MSKLPNGFSIQLNAGSYGGFYVRPSTVSFRICLGWIAFTIFFFDVEPVFMAGLKAINGKNVKMIPKERQ